MGVRSVAVGPLDGHRMWVRFDGPDRTSGELDLTLVVRRTRLVGPQPEFWDNWRYHAFVTNLDASLTDTYRHHTREPHTHENTDTDTDTDGWSKRTGTTAATPCANSPYATSKAQAV